MAEKINMKTLANIVRRRVKASGMNIADFEKNIGVSQGYLSRIAKGKGSTSFALIVNIADELGVSVDTLIEETRVEKSGLELIMNDSGLMEVYNKYRSKHIREEFEWLLKISPITEKDSAVIKQNKEKIARQYEHDVWLSFSLDGAIKEVMNGNE